MVRRKLVGLLVCSLVGVASLSTAGIPDLTLSTATTAAGVQVSVYTLPNGNGRGLNEARATTGVVDATITLTLLDGNGDPIYLYPREDLWLETTLGGLKLCPGGSYARFNTDINGTTTWSLPVAGGGYSNRTGGELTVVMINGAPLSASTMNILFNSPDITGDLQVNLTDIVQFKNALSGGYQYYADFAFDNALNLSDIVLMAQGLGTVCP